MRTLELLAKTVVWIAIAMFSLVGLSGALLGPWEFRWLYPLPWSELGADQVTLLNQLRFLKAIELAAGIFLFVARDRVFVDRAVNRALIVMLTATPLARVVSCIDDGLPNPQLLVLMGLELSGALIVILHSVLVLRAPEQRAKQSAPHEPAQAKLA